MRKSFEENGDKQNGKKEAKMPNEREDELNSIISNYLAMDGKNRESVEDIKYKKTLNSRNKEIKLNIIENVSVKDTNKQNENKPDLVQDRHMLSTNAKRPSEAEKIVCNHAVSKISDDYLANYSKFGESERKKTTNRKTAYNANDSRLAKNKNNFILGQARKSSNFRIKYNDSYSLKRKSKIKKKDTNSKFEDYTFEFENELIGKETNELTNDYLTMKNRSFVSASPYTKQHNKRLERTESTEKTFSEAKVKITSKNSKKYKVDDLIVLSFLGYGTFGSVLLVRHLHTDEVFAAKVIK
uniref:Protein kinase domain-containing protein n=1 Tax=Euplotes harpa TaxID=151035 RepID=A0A7S3JKG8_9SPIT|mmetsp:Transcript_41508/g.47875  ORF Transcript_41508/g.47875 Transcript_41508/m.47875 type:complete len:298 (+) Transcript_41508:438-1331(+)